MHTIKILYLRVLFQFSICCLSPQPHVFTGQVITYEEDLYKLETYTALNSEIQISKQFKNVLINYRKTDILTKRLVLLPVDLDKNGLLFTKRIHITNVIIDKKLYEHYLALWYTSSKCLYII